MANVETSVDNLDVQKGKKGLKDISQVMTNMVQDNTRSRLGQARICYEKEIQMKDKAYADNVGANIGVECFVIRLLGVVRQTLQDLPLNKIENHDLISVKDLLKLILKEIEKDRVQAG